MPAPPEPQREEREEAAPPTPTGPLPTPLPSGSDGFPLQPGVVVVLAGLTSDVTLNGTTGSLGSFSPSTGRWELHLPEGVRVNVRPENVRLPTEGDPQARGCGAPLSPLPGGGAHQ